jgi:hypothetical protein
MPIKIKIKNKIMIFLDLNLENICSINFKTFNLMILIYKNKNKKIRAAAIRKYNKMFYNQIQMKLKYHLQSLIKKD